MLKFYNYDIVFQEIPDEVTLAINITNCPFRCDGCHSPHLHDDIGENLDEKTLDSLLDKYGKQITCLCFMGGDRSPEEVAKLSKYIHNKTKLKTAWYSGNSKLPHDYTLFDYIKTGQYVEKNGGLRSRTTNQRMFHIVNNQPKDITERFFKK